MVFVVSGNALMCFGLSFGTIERKEKEKLIIKILIRFGHLNIESWSSLRRFFINRGAIENLAFDIWSSIISINRMPSRARFRFA